MVSIPLLTGSRCRLLSGRKRNGRDGEDSRRAWSQSRCVVELSDLDGAFIEIVEQARIDAHLAKILAKRLPMSAAAAHRTMVDTDHVIAPDIGDGFTRYANIGRRVVSGAPGSSATQRAITVRHPSRQARQFDPHVAAVTASFDGHSDL